jgi:polynucleotide 3'-phosphatase
MKQDLLSMISKSKPGQPLRLGSNALSKLQSSTPATSFSQTHNITIEGEYLIKIHPKSKPELTSTTPITAFDLDGTLINTKSGSKFSRGPNDWKWFNDKVVPSLRLIETPIVIFTNQGAVIAQKTSRSYISFTAKVKQILDEMDKLGLDVNRVWVCASPKKSSKYKGSNACKFMKMRKPDIGMFEGFSTEVVQVDKGQSVYVGDAAGRKGDFSDSDKQFAINCGMKFQTPEEFFA